MAQGPSPSPGETEAGSAGASSGQLTIALPSALQDEEARPCDHAWVLKFQYDKNNEYKKGS